MIRKLLTILLPAVACVLLSGCSDDEPWKMPGADGNTTINLLIPSAEMAYANTRAVHDATSDRLAAEAAIKDLVVIGFRKDSDGSTQSHFYAELTQDMSTEVQDVYRSYKLSVVPGKYDLYVLANCKQDLGNLPAQLKEEGNSDSLENYVKGLTHKYKKSIDNAESPCLPNTDDGLPMSGTVVNASVLEGQSQQVVVNLNFVCAKARVTVIYADNNDPLSLDIDVVDTYTEVTNLFGTSGDVVSTTKHTFPKAGTGLYYGIPTDDQGNKRTDLSYWTHQNDDMKDDAVNILQNGVASLETKNNFVYQNTLYLSECSFTGADNESSPTYFLLKGNNGAFSTRINVGCDNNSSDHDKNIGGTITRGHFYDIVALIKPGGDVEYAWKTIPWNVKDLTVQLAGKSSLYIEQSEILKIDGNTPIEIAYQTEAPSLTFDSSKAKYDSMSQELPLFEITEDRENGKLIVNVNPDLPLRSTSLTNEGMGFWVIAGSIRKWISVKEVDLKSFLRLLPVTRTLSIRNIVNEPKYSIWFDYATNEDNISLKLTSRTNTNAYKGFVDGTAPKGTCIEICDGDSVPVSKKIDISQIDLDQDNNLLSSENLLENKTYPKDGFIKVTVNDPTDATYFSKEIKLIFSAVSGSKSKTAELLIEPNPTVYTIHFKAINGVKWTNPHIYVYQPLVYKEGYEVYGKSGDKNINWIEYSFTGNMAFRGWKYQKGAVPNLTEGLSDFNDGGNSPVKGYHIGNSWGDPGKTFSDSSDDDNKYNAYENVSTSPGVNDKYMKVLLIDLSNSHCTYCKSSDSNPYGGSFKLWPGCGMVEESDGWWKIELPLLAKPGSSLVMFTDGHDTNSGTRYPGGGVPGIPLPNYSDREAWYLLDQCRGGDNCSFSDDERTKYQTDCYLISWNKKNNNQIYKNMYMWVPDESQEPFNSWPGKYRTFELGDYNYILVPVNTFTYKELDTSGTYRFKLNDPSETGEMIFDTTYVTDKSLTDITGGLKTKLESDYKGVKVTKYYVIK